MRQFRVPFEHGLHARPAAQVAAVLTGLDAEVLLSVRGREANARSVVAMMALGAGHGEIIAATAAGRQAEAALARALRPAGIHRRTGARAAPAVNCSAAQSPPVPGARLAGLVAARGLAVGLAAPLVDADPPTGEALGDAAAERARLVARN